MTMRVTTVGGASYVFDQLGDKILFRNDGGHYFGGQVVRFIESIKEGEKIKMEYYEELPSYILSKKVSVFVSKPVSSIVYIV